MFLPPSAAPARAAGPRTFDFVREKSCAKKCDGSATWPTLCIQVDIIVSIREKCANAPVRSTVAAGSPGPPSAVWVSLALPLRRRHGTQDLRRREPGAVAHMAKLRNKPPKAMQNTPTSTSSVESLGTFILRKGTCSAQCIH